MYEEGDEQKSGEGGTEEESGGEEGGEESEGGKKRLSAVELHGLIVSHSLFIPTMLKDSGSDIEPVKG